MKPFVHLHVHSQYSLLEASCRAKNLLKKAKSFDMPAAALTDAGNMFGAVEFYLTALKEGVKPIIGLDAYLAPVDRFTKNEKKDINYQPNTRLVLLAKNYKGYQNLCQLSSIGYQEGFYYKPRIDYQALKEFSSDLIVLTGGLSGEVISHFRRHGEDAAREKLLKLRDIFGENLYLEVNRTGVPEWDEVEPFLFELSQKEGVPLVAANDVYYLKKEDQLAQEVLICIGSNKTLHDESRWRLGSEEFYFKSSDQMYDLFKDRPDLCERTVEIAEQCNLEFRLEDESGKTIYHLPSFPTQDGRSIEDELRRLSYEGMEDRFQEAEEKGEAVAAEKKPEYFERLDYEMSVIKNMGFIGYFLIVQDFINWAKENNVPVGPGRGSGAGSLVAYCLKITDLDPVRYSLIFERFLNPERVSMPDFDIDFCQEKRPRVIEYVTEKYGKDSVSQIITYGKLQARAALRDVGRVLGMTYNEVDVIAKLIPEKLGITLKEALEMEPRLKEQMEMNPQVHNMIDIALKVEGLVRHAGIHAAGVIIADGKLVNHAPLYKGVDGENVVQYDMKHAEKIGLIKFDFLGLKTLTHIQYALDLIAENRGRKLEPYQIPINDPKIYELMSSGDSAGVFQFEGDGITDALRKIKPTCFEDIMAINALYRPGPMDMIPEYTKRKHGQSKVDYIFPELEEVLKETYGVIIYQEQVQLIAAKIASYSLGEADLLRRAMGKKIAEEMAQQRKRFLKGAEENQHDKERSEKLFDLMAKFAEYGFNKSHSAAYCVIAAQTAWLKAYYPVEFYAALLTTDMNDTDKVVKYVKLCRRRGIDVKAPHINHSSSKFQVKGDSIYYSLAAIKGVGTSAVEAIIEARDSLPSKSFTDLEEFFEVVDLRRVNKKVIECLIKAGAFDGFGYHRSQMFSGYDKFLDAAESKRQDAEVGQESLFSLVDESEQEKVTLPEGKPWPRMTRLTYEKEVLGFYLSDHPLNGLENICKVWANTTVDHLTNLENKSKVTLAGMVTTFKEIITKKGTRMAFVQFEDMSSSVEAIVFPNTYAECETLVKSEVPLLLTGILENKEGEAKVIVDKVSTLADSIHQAKGILFKINNSMEPKLKMLRERIDSNPGETRVKIELNLDNLKKRVIYDVRDPKGIHLSNEFLEGLQQDFGDVEFVEISR
ncbi:MAG: DNA polymerase III subunit alpha [Bdellovibrionales bacterium]|nr:DNA polymerase III subunit alpha [Bdellovibrionales bacterium]